jgi:outer membrane receptor protein involved in Fe transport
VLRAAPILIVALLIAVSLPLQAQTGGALTGTVTDSSRAVVVGATVSATAEASGQTQTVTTNGAGVYRFPFITPGAYRVEFTLQGFGKTTGRAIVAVSETATLDATLAPAGIAEQVSVTEESPLLQTDDATLGRVVNERAVQEIPLSSRNFTQLLALSPGTSAPLNDAGALGRGTQTISASGARTVSNSLTIDGIDAVNIHTNSLSENTSSSNGSVIPSPETIQEFKVQTSLYDAQFGRNAGANVNLVTKSGTAQFHGSLFEFLRNDDLNANNFFFNRNGTDRPVLKQNQFGGTVGGPIIHDKTFFFLGYQGTRQRNGLYGSSTITLPQLADDRSAKALGALFGGKTGSRGGLAVAPDGSNISPVALALLNYRLPNGQYLIPSPQSSSATGNYSVSIPANYTEDQGTLNVDHMVSSNNRLSLKAFISNQPQFSPFPTANVPGFGVTQDFKGRSFSLSDVHTFSGRLVNDFRAGFIRIKGVDIPESQLPISQFRMSRFNSAIFSDLPQLSVSGSFALGYSVDNDQAGAQNTWQYSDALSLVAGRHSIRFGGEFRRYQDNYYNNNRARGTISMLSFPDFLLGREAGSVAQGGNGTAYSNLSSTSVASGASARADRLSDYAAFVQDDWKATSRLTLNLGLRWDKFGLGVDQGGRDGNFVPGLYSAPPVGGSTSAGFVQSNNAKVLLPGLPAVDPRLINHELWKNFAPRLGFAYQLTNKLALRGGYGIFFDRLSNQIALRTALAPPNYVRSDLSGTDNASASLSSPFPVLPLPSQFPLAPLLYSPPYSPTRPALATNAIDANLKTAYSNQYALNLQWQAEHSLLFEIGYVGSKGVHLPTQRLINQAILASPRNPVNGISTNTAANASLRAPYIGFSTSGLVYLEDDTDSSYNSLQISATKRISHGLQFLFSYTFSRSIDNNSGASTSVFNTGSGDQSNLAQAKGLSDFDVTHRMVVNYIYDIPYWGFALGRNRLTNALFSGWELSGVTTWQSGTPFSITDATGATLYGETTSRASWASGATQETAAKSGSVESRLSAYFNTAAFTTAGTGWGNTGRNILRGPSQANFDFSVVKNFSLGEQRRLQWRSEFFNVFNHPNFGNPAGAVNTVSTFGSITSTVGNPRVVQFALKFLF